MLEILKAKNLSGGQKRNLLFVLALLVKSKNNLMDEPFAKP